MKKVLLLLLLCPFFFAACSSDDDDSVPTSLINTEWESVENLGDAVFRYTIIFEESSCKYLSYELEGGRVYEKTIEGTYTYEDGIVSFSWEHSTNIKRGRVAGSKIISLNNDGSDDEEDVPYYKK